MIAASKCMKGSMLIFAHESRFMIVWKILHCYSSVIGLITKIFMHSSKPEVGNFEGFRGHFSSRRTHWEIKHEKIKTVA